MILHSPAFDTAATSDASDIQDIPGNMIGYLHAKSDVIRVLMDGAAMVRRADNRRKSPRGGRDWEAVPEFGEKIKG